MFGNVSSKSSEFSLITLHSNLTLVFYNPNTPSISHSLSLSRSLSRSLSPSYSPPLLTCTYCVLKGIFKEGFSSVRVYSSSLISLFFILFLIVFFCCPHGSLSPLLLLSLIPSLSLPPPALCIYSIVPLPYLSC